MNYLFAAACALALTLAPQAHAKGRGSPNGISAGTARSAAAAYQRDHRVPYVGPGGGVRVYETCKGVGFACREPHKH